MSENDKKFITAVLSLFVVLLLFVVCFVLPGKVFLPQVFSIGPLSVHYYGICLALAVGAGWLLARRRAVKFDINLAWAENTIFWTVVGGFVGARLYHVISSFTYYQYHPADIIKVWNGGLSIYGAVIGGAFVLLMYGRLATKLNFGILDWLAPSVVAGQVVGRFGNMFNYELYGYPTHLPWKMFVPSQFRMPEFYSQKFFHPLFLYEILLNAVLLVGLVVFERRIGKVFGKGALFFWYLLLYNAFRFFLEFLRIDSVYWDGIRVNAVVSALLCAGAVGALLVFRRHYAKVP